MARNEARVVTTIWQDEDFVHLGAGAQRLYLLLLSQGGLSFCGVLDYTPKRWARLSPDTTVDDIGELLVELSNARFVVVDEDAEELWVRSALKYDPGIFRSPNLFIALARDYGVIASDPIRKGVGEGIQKGLEKGFPDGFPKGFPERLPEPFRYLLPERLQEGLGKGFRKGSSRVRARSPAPTPTPSQTAPAPKTPDEAAQHADATTNAGLRPAEVEKLEDKTPAPDDVEDDQGDELFDRFAAIWPGRPAKRAQCATVLAECRAIADDALIDECVGLLLEQDSPPRHPNYLLATVRDQLRRRGALVEP